MLLLDDEPGNVVTQSLNGMPVATSRKSEWDSGMLSVQILPGMNSTQMGAQVSCKTAGGGVRLEQKANGLRKQLSIKVDWTVARCAESDEQVRS